MIKLKTILQEIQIKNNKSAEDIIQIYIHNPSSLCSKIIDMMVKKYDRDILSDNRPDIYEWLNSLSNVTKNKLYQDIIKIKKEYNSQVQEILVKGSINKSDDDIWELYDNLPKLKKPLAIRLMWDLGKSPDDSFDSWMARISQNEKNKIYKELLKLKPQNISEIQVIGGTITPQKLLDYWTNVFVPTRIYIGNSKLYQDFLDYVDSGKLRQNYPNKGSLSLSEYVEDIINSPQRRIYYDDLVNLVKSANTTTN